MAAATPTARPLALAPFRGRPLLLHLLQRLDRSPVVVDIVVVTGDPPAAGSVDVAGLIEAAGLRAAPRLVAGGLAGAVKALAGSAGLVAVHGVAWSLAPADILQRLCLELERSPGVDAVAPVLGVTDTVRRLGSDGRSLGVVPRETLRRLQSPRLHRRPVLERGLRLLQGEAAAELADVAAVQAAGGRLALVEGWAGPEIRVAEDLGLAEAMLGGGG